MNPSYQHDVVAQSVIAELKKLLKEKDYSLLTRLLLDFLTEGEYSPQVLSKAMELRRKYNLGLDSDQLLKLHEELNLLLEALTISTLNLPQVQPEKLYEQALDSLQVSKGQAQGILICHCEQLVKQYNKSGFKFGPIDLRLVSGQLTGVVGENGNGKTTLLRLIAGDIALSSGSISFPALQGKTWYDFKNQIAYIPQQSERWYGLLKNNLHFSAANHGILGSQNLQQVNYIIHRLGLSRYENATWSQISTGFRLRFELAKALVWKPKLLILDEPLANLDVNTKLLVLQDLKMLSQSKKYPLSIILSSQQLHEIEKIVDNLIFIKNGQVIFNDKVAQLGSQRQSNTIELSGSFNREQLYEYLEGIQILSLSDSGNSFIVNLPIEVKPSEVLQKILLHSEVDYFRDISKSSRKFF
jgi:ABC-2 type transport system ATP-binding protein